MSNDSKKPEKDPFAKVEKDTRKKTEATLNRDIHKNLQKERFPESTMAKDSRADAEKVRDHSDGAKAAADDKGLKHAERHTHD